MISCRNARSGSLPGNSPSAGRSRRASRRRARSRARRSRSARRPCGVRKYLLRHGSGMYCDELARAWASDGRRSRRTRTAMRSAAGTRSVRMGHRHLALLVSAMSSHCAPTRGRRMSMPYSSAALRQHSFSRCSAVKAGRASLQLVELPVRIARAEHHHVVLAGEAEPLRRRSRCRRGRRGCPGRSSTWPGR